MRRLALAGGAVLAGCVLADPAYALSVLLAVAILLGLPLILLLALRLCGYSADTKPANRRKP